MYWQKKDNPDRRVIKENDSRIETKMIEMIIWAVIKTCIRDKLKNEIECY